MEAYRMKKGSFIGLMLFALLAFVPSSGHTAGRLNFMLTNLTGVDITDVRIAPTYYPNYISENLLKTGLDANTRIYIGPNYYGDQRFWNVTVSWSNGFQYTWTHNQLTRYNSYVIYANSYGVRMRQGYERAFARYSDNMPTMYAGAQPGISVSVGVPEKVNAVTVADAGKVGSSQRKTRDLVFDDEEEAEHPVVSGSTADTTKGETISVKATVELTRDGKLSTVLPTEQFKSNDKVRLLFSTSRDGNVYWVAKGTSGQYQVLFPSQKAGMDNTVVRNHSYTVPAKGAWRFDEQKGAETLVCVLSPSPVAELDKAVALGGEGKKDEASEIISSVVNRHENKRTTRDLVFEEEDDQDVNTKTQTSKDKEPFIATYELIHN